jgi:ketosteroid isomerase-like protein
MRGRPFHVDVGQRVLDDLTLPEHLEMVVAKEITDVQIDILGDTAIAFFISHSSVKLKTSPALHEPTFRVSMVLQRTSAGWRVIPEIERRGAALVTQ